MDFDFFEALPVREKALATAAMINFMRKLLMTGAHCYDRRGAVVLLHSVHLVVAAVVSLLQYGLIC